MPVPTDDLQRRWAALAAPTAAQAAAGDLAPGNLAPGDLAPGDLGRGADAGSARSPAPPGVRFGPSPSVAVSPGSRLCPPGWCGIVVIDGAVIATAPHEDAASLLRTFLIAAPPAAWTDPDAARALLPVAEVLGPAILAYLDPAAFRPRPGLRPQATGVLIPAVRGPVEDAARDRGGLEILPPGGGSALGTLLAAAGPADAGESGLADAEHLVALRDEAGRLVAAAGYERLPGGFAHLCVLTHPAARAQGYGRRAASSAVAAALEEGLRPQWQARPVASRRLAAALGFTERGAQLSLRLRPTR